MGIERCPLWLKTIAEAVDNHVKVTLDELGFKHKEKALWNTFVTHPQVCSLLHCMTMLYSLPVPRRKILAALSFFLIIRITGKTLSP